jgi:DNA polymerase III delta prime subunit
MRPNKVMLNIDGELQAIRPRTVFRGIRRGLLLSGPPGDGKSTAIECFVNDIAGEGPRRAHQP